MSNLKKSMSVAMGATFAVAMSASPIVNADANPFGMQSLDSGYLQVAEGKCGEGMKKAEEEGKCGEGKKKAEGKCGEGKCGEGKKAEGEGKCGEGKKKAEGEGKCGAKE